MSDFIIISGSEKELFNSGVVLAGEDAEVLLEYEKEFTKFLDKSRLNYQIELSRGTYRGKEELLYRSIETIDELKEDLKSIEKGFVEFNLQNPKK